MIDAIKISVSVLVLSLIAIGAKAGPYIQLAGGGAAVIGADENASIAASTGSAINLGFGYDLGIIGIEVFTSRMKSTMTLSDTSIAPTDFDRDVNAIGGGVRLFLPIINLKAGVASFDVDQAFSSTDTAVTDLLNSIIPDAAKKYTKTGAYFGLGASIGFMSVDVFLDLTVYIWKEAQFVAGSSTETVDNSVGNTEAVVGARYTF